MKIKKTKENLVVIIPLKQKIFNPWQEESVGEMDNLIGVQAGNEQGFCQLIDRDYKGKAPDIGDFVVKTYLENDKFIYLCQDLGIKFIRLQICDRCHSAIWGTVTMKGGETLCGNCYLEL